jgi:hypothetical protein
LSVFGGEEALDGGFFATFVVETMLPRVLNRPRKGKMKE